MTQQGHTPITILIVDDHYMVRGGIRTILEVYDDLDVIGEAASAQEAIAFCREHEPDVVLMDVKMPDKCGIAATREILKKQPEIRILALSSYHRDDYVRHMLDAGARGYLVKNASGEFLHAAIKRALTPCQTICDEARQALANPVRSTNRIHKLTPRQREILELARQGMTDKAIASHLGLSHHTINQHMNNILRKLDVKNRTQAVAELQIDLLS